MTHKFKDEKSKQTELNDIKLNRAELNDVELNSVLRNFRASVHTWSEAEFTRPRSVPARRPVFERWLAAPAFTWAAAAVLALAAGGVPLAVHHEHQVQLAARQQAEQQERLREAQMQQAREQAASQLAASSNEDDKLMEHVDADIAQSAPDALEPLARLMRSSGEE